MYQEYFIQKGVLILPIVAMAAFVLSFVAVLVWSLRPARKLQYEALAELPLEGGAVSESVKEGLS